MRRPPSRRLTEETSTMTSPPPSARLVVLVLCLILVAGTPELPEVDPQQAAPDAAPQPEGRRCHCRCTISRGDC
jgi:hypothetical protein